MLELVAIGPDSDQTWRRQLPPDVAIRLGRAPSEGWSVPWDRRISREHADLILQGKRLVVQCLDSALNTPVVKRQRRRKFSIEPGQQFRIGLTIFRLEMSTESRGTVSDNDAPTDREDAEAWPVWQLRHSPVYLDVDEGEPEASPEDSAAEGSRNEAVESSEQPKGQPESAEDRNLVPLFFGDQRADDQFDAYHRWLGISPADHPIDCYRLVGVARFESDPDVIAASADRQMAHIRNYQMGQRAHVSQLLLNELAKARLCLLCPGAKSEYDQRLQEYLSSEAETEREDVDKSTSAPPNVSINLAEFLDGLSEEDQHWKKRR